MQPHPPLFRHSAATQLILGVIYRFIYEILGERQGIYRSYILDSNNTVYKRMIVARKFLTKALEYLKLKKYNTDLTSYNDFLKHGGNNLLYDDLALDLNDIVIDAGAFEGSWSSTIYLRYGCKLEMFEPVPEFVESCNSIFKQNRSVCIHQAALTAISREAEFVISGNGTSEFGSREDCNTVVTKCISASHFIDSLISNNKIKNTAGSIGVLKLNIEGGEYEVLESLIHLNKISYIRCLLIQFHDKAPSWDTRYSKITKDLERTHICVWNYEMVWGKWVLK